MPNWLPDQPALPTPGPVDPDFLPARAEIFPALPPKPAKGSPVSPDLSDTWVEYTERPQVVGQYLDGRPQVNVSVPFRGNQLEEVYLGVMLPATAEDEMLTRKTRFEAHQDFSVFRPLKWITLGYWVDPVTFELTAYYQYRPVTYTPPQQEDTSWPTKPATFSDPP